MLGALNTRNLGNQHGFVLAGIEVAPLPLPFIVAGNLKAAFGADKGNVGIAFDKNTDFAGSEREFDFGNPPWGPNAKNLGVEIGIFHALNINLPTRSREEP